MSTSDWPVSWGNHHAAFCKFKEVFARQVDKETVEIWRDGCCIGKVQIDITASELSLVLATMETSYAMGVAAGKSTLARAILDPIQTAINQQRD